MREKQVSEGLIESAGTLVHMRTCLCVSNNVKGGTCTDLIRQSGRYWMELITARTEDRTKDGD